jgi:hypothetical protein
MLAEPYARVFWPAYVMAFFPEALPKAVSGRLEVDTSRVAPFAEGEEPTVDDSKPYSIKPGPARYCWRERR